MNLSHIREELYKLVANTGCKEVTIQIGDINELQHMNSYTPIYNTYNNISITIKK